MITAHHTFTHALSKESEICDVLAQYQYEGLCFLQAGFDVELMTLDCYLEEIHIHLEHNGSPELLETLSTIFTPFTGILYTPNGIQPLNSFEETPLSMSKNLLYTLSPKYAETLCADSMGSNDPARDKEKGVDRSGGHGQLEGNDPGRSGDPNGSSGDPGGSDPGRSGDPGGSGDPDGNGDPEDAKEPLFDHYSLSINTFYLRNTHPRHHRAIHTKIYHWSRY